MKKRLMALTLAFVLSTGPLAAAAPVSVTRDDQREVMVTIYNGNLGLVKDLREARLPAGMSEVQFMDVAALIDPTTVHLKSLTDALGLKILEQNYEYDLLSSQKLNGEVRRPEGPPLPGRRHLPRGDAALDHGPVFEINGQIHMATTAGSSCPRCPRTSWPSPRSCGSSATRRRGRNALKRRISRAASRGRPTTSWCSTPPTRSPTSRAG